MSEVERCGARHCPRAHGGLDRRNSSRRTAPVINRPGLLEELALNEEEGQAIGCLGRAVVLVDAVSPSRAMVDTRQPKLF